jgi:hypothetical protein
VTLDDELLRAAYYCCSEVLRTRRRVGVPIPDWLHAYYRRLDAAYRGLSPTRHPVAGNGVLDRHSRDGEIIGTREVAEMLGLTPRQVQRRAGQLGGTRVCGRLLFLRAEIAETVERRYRNG